MFIFVFMSSILCRVTRILATGFNCEMDLTLYPFDKHVCDVEIQLDQFNISMVGIEPQKMVLNGCDSQKCVSVCFLSGAT